MGRGVADDVWDRCSVGGSSSSPDPKPLAAAGGSDGCETTGWLGGEAGRCGGDVAAGCSGEVGRPRLPATSFQSALVAGRGEAGRLAGAGFAAGGEAGRAGGCGDSEAGSAPSDSARSPHGSLESVIGEKRSLEWKRIADGRRLEIHSQRNEKAPGAEPGAFDHRLLGARPHAFG